MSDNKEQKTKSKEQELLSFEDQLTASARRLRRAQDAELHVDSMPHAVLEHSPHRLYWGWIATPAAAVIGLLIGLFIHKPTEPAQDFGVPVVAAETAGQSILDDGTDYALFVRM